MCCTERADGDPLTHQTSNLQVWEDYGLLRECVGDMKAEARPARVLAEEDLAVACSACMIIKKVRDVKHSADCVGARR